MVQNKQTTSAFLSPSAEIITKKHISNLLKMQAQIINNYQALLDQSQKGLIRSHLDTKEKYES